ncbi:YugN family protein [Macrococcus armenti]|uniref:YugN-like family protein n=1 Tax=Macrococcus armenti TaxID=2875764 RepID=A0ABY3ZWR2_9STAP|nr:YugN family protein [Macrococcus armenti]UOB21298.1 YugN-like family protein [Macrococcus armenti]
MVFANSGIETIIADQSLIQHVMNKHGFVLGGHWDYERVTYDLKYELEEGIYYLRIPGYAVEGDVGARDAKLQMMDPYLGKHYYPTGVEYGEDEYFSDKLVEHCKRTITKVYNDIVAIQN